jgi:uncharacterized membrane protein YfcA
MAAAFEGGGSSNKNTPMDIYLPIAETPVNAALVLILGALVGFVSGLVGVGGGFLATPMLILMGIPPAIAAATESAQILASSTSGVMAHWRRQAVDVRLGLVLSAGGLLGSLLGVQLFGFLQRLGQADLVIACLYVVLLGLIGSLMLRESLAAIKRKDDLTVSAPAPRKHSRGLIQTLPLRIQFPTSRLYISVLPPIALGIVVGMLAAIMGVGGGFIIAPALIYVLRVPFNVVVGTSLFQIVLVTAFTVFLQAAQNQSVDIVLAGLLIVGGVIGAQFGAKAGQRLSPEYLRAFLAALILAVCLRMLFDLVGPRDELFTLDYGAAG